MSAKKSKAAKKTDVPSISKSACEYIARLMDDLYEYIDQIQSSTELVYKASEVLIDEIDSIKRVLADMKTIEKPQTPVTDKILEDLWRKARLGE